MLDYLESSIIVIIVVSIVVYGYRLSPDKTIVRRQRRCTVNMQLTRCQLHREENRQNEFSKDYPAA